MHGVCISHRIPVLSFKGPQYPGVHQTGYLSSHTKLHSIRACITQDTCPLTQSSSVSRRASLGCLSVRQSPRPSCGAGQRGASWPRPVAGGRTAPRRGYYLRRGGGCIGYCIIVII